MNTKSLCELGNGRYRLRMSEAGGGQSSFDSVAISRWCGDRLEDTQGFFIYLRDLDSGELWSATLQPTLVPGQGYEVRSGTDEIIVSRQDHDVSVTTRISVSPSLNLETRKVRLSNDSARLRRIELTSYVEIALADPQGDLAHPAFSKLFVQTALIRASGALVAQRRPRSSEEAWPVAFHALIGAPVLDWETDRAVFIGRGRSLERPLLAMSGTVGNVLDPILSLRTQLELEPGESREVDFVLGAMSKRIGIGPLLREMGAGPMVRKATRRGVARRSALRSEFTGDGSEYVIHTPWSNGALDLPPMPWVNVMANKRFGCLVSETGAGCTWSRNSQANRITPWSNDPVLDSHGEAVYLRDEDNGIFWSPMPGPAPAPVAHEARHGFGYSRFHSVGYGLDQEATVFVAQHDPVKILSLRITNHSANERHLSLYAYQRLVLGGQPEYPSPVQSWRHGKALCARNGSAGDFVGGVAFSIVVGGMALDEDICCDRRSFIGANGSSRAPQALRSPGLDGSCGDGLDPCFARRLRFDLMAGETVTWNILLGEAMGETELDALLDNYRDNAAVAAALDQVVQSWRERLNAIRVHTPSTSIDRMINGWLPYQALSCRINGRTAFYQSSGAYGYRDQLQDAGNLCLLWPELTRQQILLHARHQFTEGDVLHWWHAEPMERGIRTRFSDDLLWLPYVAGQYLERTGDFSILDEPVPFLRAPPLAEGQEESNLKAGITVDRATLYEHCCRALDRSLTQGEHGLPLMGAGDWNDGMNRVGHKGRGESVWLGFFLIVLLDAFIPLVRQRGEPGRLARYVAYREQLLTHLNGAGWDGKWYRRAYYDDGTPLGTGEAGECRIDGLSQAWSVLSAVAPTVRGVQAMRELESQLVAASDGLIRLLTPPFVKTRDDPGYIKGYVAGVRENGGQYTHAACWMIEAAARLGWRDRAASWLAMIAPLQHAQNQRSVERYKVEPYVIAADIYGARPHIGRGGWTWYTGSAALAYRVALEAVLGLRLENGRTLVLKPCVPDEWPEYRIEFRAPAGGAQYLIDVVNPRGCTESIIGAIMDGQALEIVSGTVRVPLDTAGERHHMFVTLGPAAGPVAVADIKPRSF
ncbi:GH36-type glycosyl hydrolase domain-containing protein [Nevskia soli]|uniref:GH36-type glycosyl hydrolase domain-containing protein n=1 Tax=Nevskia soli TaxID=418856 RepID=UPI00068C2B82|nr:glycosyl transferase [Nevskia soli]